MKRKIECSHCNGIGHIITYRLDKIYHRIEEFKSQCLVCNGKGFKEIKQKIEKILKEKPMSFKDFIRKILGIKRWPKERISLEEVYREEEQSNYPYNRGFHD